MINQYKINTKSDQQELVTILSEDGPFENIVTKETDKFILEITFDGETDQYIIEKNLSTEIKNHPLLKTESEYENNLIFGKDKTEEIISTEIVNDQLIIYKNDGSIERRPHIYWFLADKPYGKSFTRLQGNQHYKYIARFGKLSQYKRAVMGLQKKGADIYNIWNEKEASLVYTGITQFKGLKVEDVSVLSFDIEAAGLAHDETSKVFLITNTFRGSNGKITKKHFRVDHYDDNDTEMIKDWCKWVQKMNPTVINGHNIYGYDIPYLYYCAQKGDYELRLGVNNEPITINKKPSEFRVDGNTTWTYKKITIPGRHIIDGMFLAVKYDVGKNYPSWGLKQIAEYEGIVKENRQFYDASKIGQNWYDPIEREKIVEYGIDDSDDSLALYDIHIPSLFYMTQSTPKPFQVMGISATGSQLNLIMMRSYLQKGYSIPKANDKKYVAGGMSYGVPGIYKNVVKYDAASYYPSTIIAFELYDKEKDPEGNYLEMVKTFTAERFKNKRLYKETGNKYYDDLQGAQKIGINSAYGLMGTSGLHFNNFDIAAFITKCCRKGLQKAVQWATGEDIDYWWSEYKEKETSEQDFTDYSTIDKKSELTYDEMPRHNYKLVNIDTDALSFCKQDLSEFTEEEYNQICADLNKIMYSPWETDGHYEDFLVIKAKNYVTKEYGKKIKWKGSSITDSKKEKALQNMIAEIVDDLLKTKGENLKEIYHKYVKFALDITDITDWCTKKSVSKAVLNPTRLTEQKILNALSYLNPREGDKYFLYSAVDGEKQVMSKGEPQFYKDGRPKIEPNTILREVNQWDGDYNKPHYVGRVYDTLMIFENLFDKTQFIKYTDSKKHKLKNLEKLK